MPNVNLGAADKKLLHINETTELTREPAVVTGAPRVFVEPPKPHIIGLLRRVRLAQPGYDKFTGDFGCADFVDGVSVEMLNERQIDRIAMSIRVEDVDDEGGAQLGPQQRHFDAKSASAEVTPPMRSPTKAEIAALEPTEPAKPIETFAFHTLAELEAVVDAKGINGLRDIGNPLGARARAIPDLIGAILAAESKIRNDTSPAAPTVHQE
jgi:hypothetical protein